MWKRWRHALLIVTGVTTLVLPGAVAHAATAAEQPAATTTSTVSATTTPTTTASTTTTPTTTPTTVTSPPTTLNDLAQRRLRDLLVGRARLGAVPPVRAMPHYTG